MYSEQYILYLVIFSLFAYFIVTDKSISSAVYMFTQLVKVQYEKIKWWAIHNPANPIIKYLIWRRSMKLAKELMNELEVRKGNKK